MGSLHSNPYYHYNPYIQSMPVLKTGKRWLPEFRWPTVIYHAWPHKYNLKYNTKTSNTKTLHKRCRGHASVFAKWCSPSVIFELWSKKVLESLLWRTSLIMNDCQLCTKEFLGLLYYYFMNYYMTIIP